MKTSKYEGRGVLTYNNRKGGIGLSQSVEPLEQYARNIVPEVREANATVSQFCLQKLVHSAATQMEGPFDRSASVSTSAVTAKD